MPGELVDTCFQDIRGERNAPFAHDHQFTLAVLHRHAFSGLKPGYQAWVPDHLSLAQLFHGCFLRACDCYDADMFV